MNIQDFAPREVSLRGYRIDLAHHALLDASGALVELRPQALDLLCLLAGNAGKVMEKSEILALVWQGLVVTDDSLVQAIGDIRRAIDDQAHQIIQTVPRKGYRLIEHHPEPIPTPAPEAATVNDVAQSLRPDQTPAPEKLIAAFVERRQAPIAPIAHVPSKAPVKKRFVWTVALLLAGALIYWGWNLQQAVAPPRLSIVVLPFVNASGNASKEYIADSITEDITVQLSRIKGSFVIGRGTAFTYKGKAVDSKMLAKELNVRYVLQGTVDQTDAGYHITTQLIDGTSGGNLWADAIEVPMEKRGDIRQWVAAHVTSILRIKLIQAEAAGSARMVLPASEDLDMQGYAKYLTCNSKETCFEAYRLFTKAIEADPQNHTAYAHRIMYEIGQFLNYGAPRSGALFDQLNSDIAHLEGLDSLDAIGHRVLGRARFFQGRNEEALQQVDEVLQLDPNDVDALRNKPMYLVLNGRSAEAIPVAMKGMELSPQDPWRDDFYFDICKANIHLGQFKESAVWCEKAFATFSSFWPLVYLVADYTAMGDLEKAALTKDKLLKMNPEFSISWYKGLKLSRNSVWLKQVEENVWANLRKAGIPE
jgi:TolB-like protein/DNA-binding winged helix-turn-helix (wHTH) protein/tetratricopeptide (TPR) repeat protein